MKQYTINLIIFSFLLTLFISCGLPDDSLNIKKINNSTNSTENKIDINQSFTLLGSVSVQENQLSAITLQATGNNPITYSISGHDSDKFFINANSGEVVFKNAPDYETKSSYSFRAIAKGIKGNDAILDVDISILDIDEIPPVFTSSKTASVKENQLSAITLQATDDSVITYSISGHDSDKFFINANSGEVVFRNAPDYETKSSYSFNGVAKDLQGNIATKDITINIIDIIDETSPQWLSLNTAIVQENQLNAITLKATDQNLITYSISGTDSNKFNVDAISGKVVFKNAPDYETKSSYSFQAEAEDTEVNYITANITITILDIDEIPPVFTSSKTVSVKENQLSAITLQATDDSVITYSISGHDSDKFFINANSREVVFKNAPDYETKSSYSFNGVAKDLQGNIATQDITINIIDIIDETSPQWLSLNTATIQENQLNAITLKATDDNIITYSISDGDSSKFDINSSTGVITFNKKPNYQAQSLYTFIAKATDETQNITTQNITINITFISQLLKTFQGHTGSVHSLSIVDEKYFLSGSGDNTVKLWDIDTKKIISNFSEDTHYALSIATTLDEKYFLSSSDSNSLRLWNINTKDLIRTFRGHTDRIHSILVHQDGQHFLSAGGHSDTTINLWDIDTGVLAKTFQGHIGGVHALAMTPDGKYFVSGGTDETIKLWDINRDIAIKTLTGHKNIVSSLAITLDGKYILSGSNDNTIKKWNLSTGALEKTFTGHTDIVKSLAITPNGKYILSGSGDKTLKLWDINTGTLIRTFRGHTEYISSVVITKDGKYALSGSWDHTIKMWNIQIEY